MISYLCKANSKLSPHYIFCNNVIFTLSLIDFLEGWGMEKTTKSWLASWGFLLTCGQAMGRFTL